MRSNGAFRRVSLSAQLARRFDVREDDEARLMRHTHQGIPEEDMPS